MKKFILIILALCCQAVYPQWEKVDLCSDSSFGFDECSADTLIFGKQDSLILSTNLGKSWKDIYDDLPSPTVIKFKDNIIVLGSWWQGLFISLDLGDNWTERVNGLPDRAVINTILLSGDKIFAGLDGGMYVSSNLGKKWSLQNNGITIKKGYHVIVFDILAKEADIYTSTLTGIYLSTDNGESWLPKNNGLPIDTIYFHKLEISGENIYAFELSSEWNNRIYLSKNMGESWSKKNNKFLNREILLSMKAAGNNLFAATDYGLYLSKDKGDNWENLICKDTSVYYLFIIGEYIYAGTSYGILRAKISDFTDVKDNNELTKTNSLIIYPNPTTSTVSFNFLITSICSPSIKLYNSLGLLVYNELCPQLFPGKYAKSIDVSSFSAGTYTLVICQNNTTIKAKLVVIR